MGLFKIMEAVRVFTLEADDASAGALLDVP